MNLNKKSFDFTFSTYEKLLIALKENKYNFSSFVQYLTHSIPKKKEVILRHDVDNNPNKSLFKAEIETSLGIFSTYYFRCVPQSFDEGIIKKIADLGHEIGYHYEDLSKARGDYKLAIKNFEKNLIKFRYLYPVKTICMHGSPLSKWDNKKLWEKYN